MTWALVQTGNSGNTYWNGSAVTTFGASFPAPVTSGNLVIGHFSNDIGNGAALSVTDDKGNSYTIGTAFDITGDDQAHGWFYLPNITNGPQTISVNLNGNPYCVVEFWEVSGLAASSPTDVVQGLWQSAPGSGTDAVHSNATGTATTAANEVAFGLWLADRDIDSRPIAAGSGWTLRSQVSNDPTQTAGQVILATETMDIATSGTLAKATFTAPNGAGEYSTIVVTLKPAAGVTPQPLTGRSSGKGTGRSTSRGAAVLQSLAPAQAKNRATPGGATGLRSISSSQAKNIPGLLSKIALRGLSPAQATNRALSVSTTSLQGVSPAQAKGRAGVTATVVTLITQMSGTSFRMFTAKAAGVSDTALQGRSSSQSRTVNFTPHSILSGFSDVGRYTGKSRMTGTLSLGARSASMRQSIAGISHPIPLSARSFLDIHGKISGQGTIPLAGQTLAEFKAKGFGIGSSAIMGGRSSSQSKGRVGAASLPAGLLVSGRSALRFTGKGIDSQPAISIAGRSLTQFRGKATALAAILLSALSASQSKGRDGLAKQVVLRARLASHSKARAVVTGPGSIAGRSLAIVKGKAAGAGASPLAARATAQSKGRASIVGQVFVGAVTGRGASQAKGRGTISGRVGISGSGASQAKARPNLGALGSLRASAAAQAKGRGSSARLVLLAGRSVASGKGSGALLRATRLSGGSLSISTGRATSAPRAVLAGRSSSQAKGLAGLTAFARFQALLGRAGSQSKGRSGIIGHTPMTAVAGRTASQAKARGAGLTAASSYIPGFFPPISPWVMPYQPFDAVIQRYGISLTWERSHQCSCLYGSYGVTGSPDPQCQTCHGLGWYWDEPFGPFQGLITFIRLNPSPDEPGALMNEKWGVEIRQEPTVTIPFSAGLVWEKASVMDRFVEVQALDRFNTVLIKGGNEDIPYRQELNVAPTGAVTIYNEVDHEVIPVDGYTVNGTTVTIPDGYPEGTAYTVEFIAAKTYIAWRGAGAVPHDRPFGQVTEPKRFRFQTLDLWLRSVKTSGAPLRFSRLGGRSLIKTAGKATTG